MTPGAPIHWVTAEGELACGAYGPYGKLWSEVDDANCTTEPEGATCSACKAVIVERSLENDDHGGIKASTWDSLAGSVGLVRKPGERSNELRARLVTFVKTARLKTP